MPARPPRPAYNPWRDTDDVPIPQHCRIEREQSGQHPALPDARAHDAGRLLMPTTLTERGIDPAAATTLMPRVNVTVQLSARTVAWLAGHSRARRLVSSVWDTLAELERAGHHPRLIAALRRVLAHHQPTPAGRCLTCRRWKGAVVVFPAPCGTRSAATCWACSPMATALTSVVDDR
ncbi:MAG: hypothetical protein ACRDUV_06225 [Pseudonocardiaceae bacterium]